MRGRRPKPTELKELEGNPGHRPLNPDEPQPPASAAIFADPPELANNPIARDEWRRLALTLPSWITDVDRGMLLASCVLYARMCRAAEQIEKTGGDVIEDKRTGAVKINPFIRIHDKTFQSYRHACIELGLTPSARTRLRDAEQHGGGDEAPGPDAAGDMRGFVQ